MKKEHKYFIAGVAVSLCLTGTIVNASSGNSIFKVIENVKYMFDGVEKRTEDQSFIYNNRIYVPLRFIAEESGKKVYWDEDKQTVWIGKKEGSFDYLNKLVYLNYDGLELRKFSFTSKKYTIANQTYLHGIKVDMRDQEEGSITYNLADKYKLFSGFIGIEDFTKDSKNIGSVVIYNDGIEVYRVDQIVGGEEPIAFNVNVEGTSKLKIVFQSLENNGKSIQICIVEPKLLLK